VNTNIFREYDIRGIVGEHLTDETVTTLGSAMATFFVQNGAGRIAIGYDARKSSPRFCDLLIDRFNRAGLDVLLIGMVPTPVLYHTVYTREVDGGVMITGSHNPPDHNGFKICLGRSTLFGSQIREIRDIALSGVFARGSGSVSTVDVLGDYCRDIVSKLDRFEDFPQSREAEDFPQGRKDAKGQQAETRAVASVPDRADGAEDFPQSRKDAKTEQAETRAVASVTDAADRRLKVVVDGGNGMGGLTAVPVFEALGVELIPLFIEPDSDFPNHHPDPTVTENLQDTIRAVREHKADVGFAFDGDGDRIGVVDETGRIIWGDELMVLLSRSILEQRPGATIIAEVKCSQNLFDDIESHGGTAIMWKAGHSLIKAKMKETQAALAGEMSGHIFFADRFYGFDDATYAGARVLEILWKTGKPLSELLADIPPTFSTPELRIDCPDDRKFEIVAHIAEHFAATNEVITIDGARILFEHGWGLVRASNTQAILVLRFEADTAEHLDAIRSIVEMKVAELVG
jgi:phosphomannomutase/phosphoglucomutase